MILGVCSWIYGSEPLESLLGRLARFGYPGIELSGEPAQFGTEQVRQLLRRYRLRVPFTWGTLG